MDSYTDVRGQCCGCRHVSCNTSGPSGRGSFRQTDYPDMNTFPWAVNNDYNVAPAESFAGGQYTGRRCVTISRTAAFRESISEYAPDADSHGQRRASASSSCNLPDTLRRISLHSMAMRPSLRLRMCPSSGGATSPPQEARKAERKAGQPALPRAPQRHLCFFALG